MSEYLNYERYVVTPGSSIEIDNSETVVARHPHPEFDEALVVWTEQKELPEEPLDVLEKMDGGETDEWR